MPKFMLNFFYKIMLMMFHKDVFLKDKSNYLFLYVFLSFSVILLFYIDYSIYSTMNKYNPTFMSYLDLAVVYLNILVSTLIFISSFIIYKRNKEKFMYKNKFGLVLQFILLEFILINYGFVIIFILYLFGGRISSRIKTLLLRPEKFGIYS